MVVLSYNDGLWYRNVKVTKATFTFIQNKICGDISRQLNNNDAQGSSSSNMNDPFLGIFLINFNRIYNKMLDCDWFSARLFDS